MYSSYEVLKKALKKERQSYDYYAKLAVDCPNEQVKALLEKLRDEESKHLQMIDSMLIQIELGHEPL